MVTMNLHVCAFSPYMIDTKVNCNTSEYKNTSTEVHTYHDSEQTVKYNCIHVNEHMDPRSNGNRIMTL